MKKIEFKSLDLSKLKKMINFKSLKAKILVPFMVYYINGANDFWSGFWQMTIILWIMNFHINMVFPSIKK